MTIEKKMRLNLALLLVSVTLCACQAHTINTSQAQNQNHVSQASGSGPNSKGSAEIQRGNLASEADKSISTSVNQSDLKREGDQKTDPNLDQDNPDPLEPLNRMFFTIHNLFDKVLIKPFVEIYRTVLPTPIQKGVHNFVNNLFEPVNFANNLLQARWDNAGKNMVRFLSNSTIGIGGLFDPATTFGFEPCNSGFGKTLTTWGVKPGPYLFIPIIGPSTFSQTVGMVGDYFMDPLNYYYAQGKHKKHRWQNYTRYGLYYVDERKEHMDNLNLISKHALDEYVALRSFYLKSIEMPKPKNP